MAKNIVERSEKLGFFNIKQDFYLNIILQSGNFNEYLERFILICDRA